MSVFSDKAEKNWLYHPKFYESYSLSSKPAQKIMRKKKWPDPVLKYVLND